MKKRLDKWYFVWYYSEALSKTAQAERERDH